MSFPPSYAVVENAAMNSTRRNHDDEVHGFVSPYTELNAGLWSLFAGATIFLTSRLWIKTTRRHGLWYDDHILIVSWAILLANNILIIYEFATGYVLKDSTQKWDDRMHILINVSSCGTLIGQALTKTAFGVTLLRMSNRWQRWVLWFCIFTMNLYMILKVIFQWAKVCGKSSYQNWYRLDFCIGWTFREDFKEGGNVYNIIMDFVFASFPWLITRHLDMQRMEKIGLCITMSLGMVVAIVSAIRVSWKDQGNGRDQYYMWRNGMSQVWYSSEIAGTIIVQCVPILRPILRDIHTSLTSRKLTSTGDTRSTTWMGSNKAPASVAVRNGNDATVGMDRLELRDIPGESIDMSSDSLQPAPLAAKETATVRMTSIRSNCPSISPSESWVWRGPSCDGERNPSSSLVSNFEEDYRHGLSAPPQRRAF